MTARINVGNVPEPDELYGREALLEDSWLSLERNNLLLLGPRRFGKSGVLRHMHRLPRQDFLTLWLDLQDVATPPEFVGRLVTAAARLEPLRAWFNHLKKTPSVLGHWFKTHFEKIGVGEVAGITFRESLGTNWANLGRDLLSALEKTPRPLLFLLDEFPEMLKKLFGKEGKEEAVRFSHWFRTVRLDEGERLRRHRFALCGSTGLNYLLDRRLGCADAFNDFCRLSVEPLTFDAAARLCRDLAATCGMRITDEDVRRLLDGFGKPVAYFIHLFFSKLAQQRTGKQTDLDGALVKAVHAGLLEKDCKQYFTHYARRLDQYGKRLREAVVCMLSAVADGPADGQTVDKLRTVYDGQRGQRASGVEFAEVLGDLECDWYLHPDPVTRKYVFSLKIMGDWWRRWYGPAAVACPGVV